jgi:hypothetical protein
MRVKELISQLQVCDPECEVNVVGMMINFVEELPPYYDGSVQIRTDTGVKFCRKGHNKVLLRLFNWENLMMDDSNTEVDISELADFDQESFGERVETLREECKAWDKEHNNGK